MRNPSRVVKVVRLRPEVDRYDLCPCGSGKKSKWCCFKNGELIKPPARVSPRDPRVGHSNSRCYACHLNDCDERLTREHYISEALLEAVGPDLMLAGLPWLKNRDGQRMNPGSVVAKILCDYHNRCLSPLDAAATRLFKAAKEHQAFVENKPMTSKTILVAGEDIEKWLLKVICGMVASRNVSHGGQPDPLLSVSADWVDILFDNKPWPEGWGLYFYGAVGSSVAHDGHFRFRPYTSTDIKTMLGAEFDFSGFRFLLVLDMPKAALKDDFGGHVVFRPRRFVRRFEGEFHAIELSWLDRRYDKVITLE